MNLMTTASRLSVTGQFSARPAKEPKNSAGECARLVQDKNFTYIPDVDAVEYSKNASYIHICENNTIYAPLYKAAPCDVCRWWPIYPAASSPSHRRLPIRLIYFGVQKNVAPAHGCSHHPEDLMKTPARYRPPAMLDYKTLIDAESMYNTPPCYTIYMMALC